MSKDGSETTEAAFGYCSEEVEAPSIIFAIKGTARGDEQRGALTDYLSGSIIRGLIGGMKAPAVCYLRILGGLGQLLQTPRNEVLLE